MRPQYPGLTYRPRPTSTIGEITFARMRRDYLYPSVGDRESPSGWLAHDRPTALARAETRARDILANHFPEAIAAKTDAAIRAEFDIRLAPEAMRCVP